MRAKKFLSAKRKKYTFSTDFPLTSERVKVILSKPNEGTKLVEAIRKSRHGENEPFTLLASEDKD